MRSRPSKPRSIKTEWRVADLQVESQHQLIALLLDKGADLAHEDDENEVSFSMQARYDWYNHSQGQPPPAPP